MNNGILILCEYLVPPVALVLTAVVGAPRRFVIVGHAFASVPQLDVVHGVDLGKERATHLLLPPEALPHETGADAMRENTWDCARLARAPHQR